ncbi:MAG: hypothetical protein DRN03_00345 [Thermoplasmata archaeon]|nr:MAG: hypothetical protein DRN03_00345 [Thermoplasmata archaeon]
MKPENKSTYFKISKEGDVAKGTVELRIPKESIPESTIPVTETEEKPKPRRGRKRKKEIMEK